MTWHNWAGNQRTEPVRRVVAPDVDGVAAAVKAAAREGLRVKATGSGHSFTGIGVPDGVALAAPSDPRGLQVHGELVTVPAGMTIRTLNALLWDRGRTSATSTPRRSRAPSRPAPTAPARATRGSPRGSGRCSSSRPTGRY